MQQELVSIITPMYNGAKYVSQTIESVQAQSYLNWEMIIINDGSKDNGPQIVADYAVNDPRIKLINQPNGGSASARNNGLRNAQGRYICFLDSDDTWDSDFLSSQLLFIAKNNAMMVYSSFRRVDISNKEILRPYIVPARVNYRGLLKNCHIGCLSVMIDKSKSGEIFFNEDLKSLRDDFALWLSILKTTDYAYGNPNVICSYRIMTTSATGNKRKVIKPQWNIYRNIEKLGLIPSSYYMLCWAINGILKYSK